MYFSLSGHEKSQEISSVRDTELGGLPHWRCHSRINYHSLWSCHVKPFSILIRTVHRRCFPATCCATYHLDIDQHILTMQPPRIAFDCALPPHIYRCVPLCFRVLPTEHLYILTMHVQRIASDCVLQRCVFTIVCPCACSRTATSYAFWRRRPNVQL